MKTQLIPTQDHLLLIDNKEAEIKGSPFLCYNPLKITWGDDIVLYQGAMPEYNYRGLQKIIAYYPLTKEAKELDLPLLPNPFDDKTYWIATVIFKDGTKLKSEKFYKYDSGIKSWSSKFSYLIGDKIESISYDKHIENQPEQFSLEDIKKAFEYYAFTSVSNQPYNDSELEEQFEKFIQSLSTQQLPIEFIPVYQEDWRYNIDEGVEELYDTDNFKTITNSEGKQELVGTYKY